MDQWVKFNDNDGLGYDVNVVKNDGNVNFHDYRDFFDGKFVVGLFDNCDNNNNKMDIDDDKKRIKVEDNIKIVSISSSSSSTFYNPFSYRCESSENKCENENNDLIEKQRYIDKLERKLRKVKLKSPTLKVILSQMEIDVMKQRINCTKEEINSNKDNKDNNNTKEEEIKELLTSEEKNMFLNNSPEITKQTSTIIYLIKKCDICRILNCFEQDQENQELESSSKMETIKLSSKNTNV